MAKLGKALQYAERERAAVRGHKRGQKPVEWLHRVDVIDMLERLEIQNIGQSSHDEIVFSCPFSGHSSGDSRPSAYMNDGSSNKEKATVWKCHGCGRAGNAITFVAEHEDISKPQATRWLRELYASGFRAPKGGIAEEFEQRRKAREAALAEDAEITPIPWKKYERLFNIDWFKDQDHKPMQYMIKRGFEPRTLQRWRIGYDPISERLTIPVCNVDGELIGVKGRTHKPKKQERNKYMILGDAIGKPKRYGFLRYPKSRVLFGLDWHTDENRLVLVEGELDVIALWQMGIPAVSTGSSSVSEEQAVILRDYADEVVIYFDLDDSGINAIAGYEREGGEWKPGLVDRLSPFMRVLVIVNHDGDAAFYQEAKRASEVIELVRNAVPAHKLMLD